MRACMYDVISISLSCAAVDVLDVLLQLFSCRDWWREVWQCAQQFELNGRGERDTGSHTGPATAQIYTPVIAAHHLSAATSAHSTAHRKFGSPPLISSAHANTHMIALCHVISSATVTTIEPDYLSYERSTKHSSTHHTHI